MKSHPIFRVAWWTSNLLLAAALVSTAYSAVWEISVRRYLNGFSDAIVSDAATPQQKAEAILAWMANGPPRLDSTQLPQLSPRDPENTLNYRELLAVCGGATNALAITYLTHMIV